MSWLTRRAVKKFIENPDKYLVANPKFCEHVFVDGVCTLCHIPEDVFLQNSIECVRCGKIHTKDLGEFCLECRTKWHDIRDKTLANLKENFITKSKR
jgi:hypothetical protein